MRTHRFKRLALCLLAACMILSLSTMLAALDSTQALMAAYALTREKLRLEPTDVTIDTQHHDQATGLWTFIFRQKVHPDTNGQIFIQLNADGSVHEFRAPRSNQEIELEEQMRIQWAGRPSYAYDFRGVAEWAQLKADWMEKLPLLEQYVVKANESRPQLPYGWRLVEVLYTDIRLPDADAIPIEEARRTAVEAVLTLPEFDQEKLDQYEPRMEIYYHSKELNKPVYQFAYAQQLSPNTDAEFDRWLRTYMDPLDAMFGGGEFAAPMYVSVRIDARTGDLAEAPNV